MPPKTSSITHLYRPIAGLVSVAALALGLFFVGLMLQVHAAEATPLLPNLVADPPDNVSFETSQTDGGLSGERVTPELLLRFNGYVHNVGPGALDFRGSREAPKVSKATNEEVERHREKEEGLPQKTEEELASPPMKASQRLFMTNEGNPEKSEEYLGRSHEEVSSSAEMFYVNADGHHHWHLQRVAKYSLWNAAKTAEVAPAQKVGFCLEDSEHVEPSVGPTKPVYADNVPPFRDFCQQYRPNATGVYEGISPGWRDRYTSDLGFQWVDASNVLPGEYWLREDVNPTGVIKEAAGTNTPAYSTTPTIVPGFDALSQAASTQTGEPKTLTLTSKAWNDSATPKYTIVSAPQHGTLGTVSKNQVTYTPAAGYTGPDTFTFAASDPTSEFPRSPAVATVSIEVATGTGPAKGLLVGDATSAYSVGDQTTSGREESFQFTAKSSGTVEELQFRTNATANTGVTGVTLGVFAENAGKPGEVLGKATVAGEPAVSSWVKVTGLSTAVVSGTKYWLVVLPLGASSTKLHYNAAVGSGGAGNLESVATGLSALTAESSWETFNQGPVGFQAIGSSASQPPPPPPAVTIEGAPTSMSAGTSVQLTAHVSNDSPTVTWKVSSGSITTAGLYSAPSEPPVGGKAVVTATTAKGAQTQVSIEITAVAAAKGLLVGDATSAYSVGDQTTSGREESFQFTAKSSGTVEELQFRTNATANTGVTGVTLGVFAENAGKPGEVLGKATVAGEPAVSSWVKVTGLSTAVVSGTKYWLVVLPLGASSTKLHYNAAVGSGGAGNLESVATGLSALTAESSWETFNQGPVGFQAIGPVSSAPMSLQAVASAHSANAAVSSPATAASSPAVSSSTPSASTPAAQSARLQPSVAIAGAPADMIAGTSVQLSALLNGGGSRVTWHTSAGSITSGGLYTAPLQTTSGVIVLSATDDQGTHDRRRITIVPVASPRAAPAVPLEIQAGPQAQLVDGKLVMTTSVREAGKVRLSAYIGKRRLGSCAAQTPANRSFTCRLDLGGASPQASIGVLASLRVGGKILKSTRAAGPIPQMHMSVAVAAAVRRMVRNGNTSSAWAYICSPPKPSDGLPTAFG
jgi:Lysyl oxidase/Bacterial Ig domain